MSDSNSLTRGLRDGSPEAISQIRGRVRRILAFSGYDIPAEERLDLEQTIMLQLWQAVSRPEFEHYKLWGFVDVLHLPPMYRLANDPEADE